MESWKEELDRKYEEVTNRGDMILTDKANEIILEAISKLPPISYPKRIRISYGDY